LRPKKGETNRSLLILALALIAALGVGCGSSEGDAESSSAEAETRLESPPSPYGNVDLANTRDAESSLAVTSVSELEQAWSRPLNARTSGSHYIASPVLDEGVVYLQDPTSNVEAIDLASGELLWEKNYGVAANGTHGVIVAAGKVFGATPTSAFALDADTGEEIWSTKLIRNSSESIQMAPGVHEGRVYLSTVPIGGEGNEVGVLWALDADSGSKLWHFDQVPRSLWGHPEINYGGGIYYPPAFDGEGSLYVGISHAGPIPGVEEYPWGTSRPGLNLYSQSIVKLDEETGEVQWHYQITPHGLCNGYLISPVLTEVRGRKVVLGAGALGIVVAVDQKTGKPLWRRPVGKHNGHDNDGLKAMRGEYASLKIPMTVYPGTFGGVAAAISVQGSTAFVPVVNGPTRLTSQTEAEELGTPTGELVAVDIGTGAIKWKQRFPASLYGPTTVTNDLVFVSTYDGTLAAFEIDSGKEVWREKLPTIVEGGMTITGDTLLVRAGSPQVEVPKLLAYRLPS
jgi:alcohol dehydrogenase (cytochrome c)